MTSIFFGTLFVYVDVLGDAYVMVVFLDGFVEENMDVLVVVSVESVL